MLTDWLLGFSGPRSEAIAIKREIAAFLHTELKLELSEEKTLITHARTASARFLGYEITTLHNDRKLDRRGHRSINGGIGLKVPAEVIKAKCGRYLQGNKPIHRVELIHDSAYSLIVHYQQEYRGLVEYYRMAYNLHQFGRLKWVMERSLTQTLALKFRISVRTVYRRHQNTFADDERLYKVLETTVERPDGQKPLVARWGGISLAWKAHAILNDAPLQISKPVTELEQRLLANQCELCGSTENIQVHHVRALKDLHTSGRKEKSLWVRMMAARKRKTLVVCKDCHHGIHIGRPPRPVTAHRRTLESRVL